MILRLFSCILFLFLSSAAMAQNPSYGWTETTGSNMDEQGYAIATDVQSNIYVGGYYNLSIDFDPTSAVYFKPTVGMTDIFIQKLNSAGNLVWANQIGSTGEDVNYDIVTDAFCNIYHTGSFSNTADFD